VNILIYCYFPPLRRHLAGGAQRFLDGLLTALSAKAVEITVACPPLARHEHRPDGPRLKVVAELARVDGDPTPAQAHHDAVLLADLAERADVVVTIDRTFPLDVDIPVVLCLNNFSYGPETRSVFDLAWDTIVVPSNYLRNCITWYFRPAHWAGEPRPVEVIPCGINRPAAHTLSLPEALALPAGGRFVGFPHRPDPDKGYETAVQAVLDLRQQGHNFTLLVPTPKAHDVWPHQARYLDQRARYTHDVGAALAVHFHRWIEASEMTDYLQLCEWSLCLSRLPEGFGLSVLEAVAAGVPVVSTPAGAFPELLPPNHGVEHVDFDDSNAVATLIAAGSDPDAIDRGTEYINSYYDWDTIANRWIDVLRSTRKSSSRYRPLPVADESSAPWFRLTPSGRSWHDYRMAYQQNTTAEVVVLGGD
jgi:glycosyltransferase involved in cell wall biosynthesis